MNFKCIVPYRKFPFYHRNPMQVSKEYKRLMKHIGIAIKQGKEVIFEHSLSDNEDWYDQITVQIND